MLPNPEQFKLSLMFPQVLRSALESFLNKLISHTAGCEIHLRKLDNKILSLNLQGLDFPLFFVFSAQRVEILGCYDDKTDSVVSLSPRLLLKVPKKSELSQFLNNRSIQLQGDLQVLQDFVALLEFLEKEPAELLSRYIGDVPAQACINFLAKLKQILQYKLRLSQQFWGERLTEEWQVISPKLAIADFCAQVEQLAQDVVQLEQKIQTLCK